MCGAKDHVRSTKQLGYAPSHIVSRGLQSARESGMAKLIKARKKSASAKPTYIEPITCPHCGGQASIMRRTPHPQIKGEVWTFECKDCGKQTEKSKLN
jgi:rRNA maturation protein Nop10